MKKQILALVMGTAFLAGCSHLCEECQKGTCDIQPQKVVYTSTPTLFRFDSTVLSKADRTGLNKTAAEIKQDRVSKVLVKGYADVTGPESYNLVLSQKRADAVANYLIKEGGVCPKKVTAKGYGETTKFNAANTPAGRAQNRRVEVVVE